MDKNNYFIKAGYKNQKANHTLSVKEGDLYWTDERVKISSHYQYNTYTMARDLIRQHNLKSTVDVGCGAALKLMEVIYPVCSDVMGTDQKEAIDYCKQRFPQGKFYVENLENPKKAPREFDLVICADVIEHMEDPDKLLNYIKKLSKRGGYIVISTPERDVLRGKDNMGSPKAEHIREWNKEELIAYLTDRGFKVLNHQMQPIMKPSLFIKEVREVRRKTRERAGTVNINQVIVCQVK